MMIEAEDESPTFTGNNPISRLRMLRVETQSLNSVPTAAGITTSDDLETNSAALIQVLRKEVSAVKQEIKDIHERES